MAGVFLSYDRDDSERARHFARALEKAGHNVWWDLHVRGGTQFGKVIEEALKAADAVVVLWSANSVESAWVKDEAAAGRDSGRLVPVTIDGTEPPLGFRQFQTIDLSQWRGRGNPAALHVLLNDVASMGKESTRPAEPAAADEAPPPQRQRNWLFGGIAVAATIAITALFLLWHPWQAHAQPTLVVRAAASDEGSRSLARDLAVELGSLQGVQSNSIRLVSETEAAARRPDLIFEISQSPASSGSAANVTLTNGKDGTILWSEAFQPAAIADLKQQVGFSAARVVGCAGEALDPDQRLAQADTFKTYLNACAKLAEAAGEGNLLLTGFRRVVAQAPRFVPGWRKLLLVEAGQIDGERDDGAVSATDAALLRSHIAAALALVPGMPEALVAESSLLPLDAVGQRLALLDEAKATSPDNPAVLSRRSSALQSVGRMHDAINDASHAAEVDPLSPAIRASSVNALAFAGQVDAARQQILEVNKLWPGSAVAKDLEFRFNARFGDPRIALPYAQQRALKGLELYLEAKIDPSKVDSYVAWLVAAKDKDSGH
ncbi:MAG TPA: TIR domain-containing protein, partial [Sphingomicrobium sp.]